MSTCMPCMDGEYGRCRRHDDCVCYYRHPTEGKPAVRLHPRFEDMNAEVLPCLATALP